MLRKIFQYIPALNAVSLFYLVTTINVAQAAQTDTFISGNTNATILAGRGLSYGYSIAVHESGDVYISGKAKDINWPITPRLFGSALSAKRYYAFVARLDPDLSSISAVAILNGSGNDAIHDIAVDQDGSLLVLGHTSSSDFTQLDTGKQPYRGKTDLFVARLNVNLDELMGIKLLGGSDYDYGRAMVVAPSRDIYVTGVTGSADFPVTADAYNTKFYEPKRENTYSYGLDAFIAKLPPTLDRIEASTLFGKIDDQHVYDIALDDKQNVYITGTSFQNGVVLTPGVDNAGGRGGVLDLFVAKFDPSLRVLLAATSWGGADQEYARGIAVRDGHVYISGYSQSMDFPWTTDALQRRRVGSLIDSFVVKITDDLKKIVYSSLVGGVGLDFNRGLFISDSGDVLLFGNSNSGGSFPRAIELTHGSGELGDYGFYTAVLGVDLKPLRTFIFGGRAREQMFDLVSTPGGDIYAVGTSSSLNIDGARLLSGPPQKRSLNVLIVRIKGLEGAK